MKNSVQWAEEEIRSNRKLVRKLEKLLIKCPEGKIEMTTTKGRPKFFLVQNGTRQYLRKNESRLVQGLLEKSYYQDLMRKTRKNQRALEYFIKNYDPSAQADTYAKMHFQRKRFVTPLVEPDEELKERWLEEHKTMAAAHPNPFPIINEFVTMNGEKVRSKSEKIIADLLYRLGIPYVYECPLQTGSGTLYPDFTILNMQTRETWYWEHRGRMDSSDYAEDTIRKFHRYSQAGIFPGRNLILSEETSSFPLRIEDVELMIKTLLL
ncbi:MAG: hypothetical protein IKG97_00435 [Lachnospiraceae bacterium]|nr:hypothetical protein [Lachnospiraceae bacterium]